MGWFGRIIGAEKKSPFRGGTYEEAVGEATLLLEHAVKKGVDLPAERLQLIAGIVTRAPEALGEERVAFWMAYHELAKKLLPVTGASLRAVNGDGQEAVSAAAKTVRRYRLIGFAALVLVLVAQVYWVVGMDLYNNMTAIFEARQKEARESGLKWHELYSRMDETKYQGLSVLNQELDANYRLLQGWNRVWQGCFFIAPYQGALTGSVRTAHGFHMMTLTLDGAHAGSPLHRGGASPSQMGVAMLNVTLDKARNAMFMTKLSAGFVLRALQVYLLPLLYGLLGAATFVLRCLSKEIRDLTFLPEYEVKYRLRLSLGSLAGLAVGWFLRADEAGLAGALSPLALAFLIGYNIEILFSWMDRAIAEAVRMKSQPVEETGREKS